MLHLIFNDFCVNMISTHIKTDGIREQDCFYSKVWKKSFISLLFNDVFQSEYKI